jgi:hypothetical protein
MRTTLHCLLWILLLSVLVGCGKRVEDRGGLPREQENNGHEKKEDSIRAGKEETKRVKVEGVVTLDGEKVSGVMVMFLPVKKAEGKPAFGVTDEEGTFTLSTSNPGDGAVPGEYKVVITENATANKQGNTNKGAPRKRIPKQYSDQNTSSLTFQVNPERKRIQINLQSE